ncbi:MAG: hypothetical protein AAF639_11980 [Chloroflexota bacterium]
MNKQITNDNTLLTIQNLRSAKTKVTSTNVKEFLNQIDAIQEVKKYDEVTRWYVSKAGYFEPAKERLEEDEIYYTDLAQFNQLANLFGFLGFPEKVR